MLLTMFLICLKSMSMGSSFYCILLYFAVFEQYFAVFVFISVHIVFLSDLSTFW